LDNIEKIDFVIPWVDGSDTKWIEERNKYLDKNDTTNSDEKRYRDWDILKYWFRGVEKYAPWVNNIYFITWEHIPEWLNTNVPKLKIINHKDYIPEQYLPTFSSHVIELNMHRIKGLSEQFVYFNDDFFLTDYVDESDFFEKGLPKDIGVFDIPISTVYDDEFKYYLINSASILDRYFDKRKIEKDFWKKIYSLKYGKLLFKNIFLKPFKKNLVFYNKHLPQPFLKSTFEKVWRKEGTVLDEVSRHKFRNYKDVSQCLMSWWQICEGNFVPTRLNGKYYSTSNQDDYDMIASRKYKYICINDSSDIDDYVIKKKKIQMAFEKVLSEKSVYEK